MVLLNKKKGVEIEYHVIDVDGNLSYSFFDLVEDLPWVHKEIGLSMIEIVTEPHENLLDLSEDLYSKVALVSDILQKHNLFLCPSSKLGSEPTVMRTDDKYVVQKKLFGNKLDIATEVCGTHVHTDKDAEPEDIKNHFNALIALDPFFTLLSTSPYYRSENTDNNSRILAYRNNLYGDFPEIGQLNTYINSAEDIFNANSSQSDFHGLMSEVFTITKTASWAPIRITNRTIESRSCDTNIPSAVLSFVAVMQGVERGISQFKLPSYSFVKYCETAGSTKGLKDKFLHKYFSETISFAEKYLSAEEKKYLLPLKQMLNTKQTFATMLSAKIKNKKHVSQKDICKMRVFAANCLLKDVKSFSVCG